MRSINVFKNNFDMDIVEILKNAPQDLELYSPVYGKVYLVEVYDRNESIFPIACRKEGLALFFNAKGQYHAEGECMLYPNKNHTWQDWQVNLFKRGDIVKCGDDFYIVENTGVKQQCYNVYGELEEYCPLYIGEYASIKERGDFLKELNNNGYVYNWQTYKLESAKRCAPKKECVNYEDDEIEVDDCKSSIEQMLQPFDKILVRNAKSEHWELAFFADIVPTSGWCVTINEINGQKAFNQFIPYNEETKALYGTKNEYNGKYKTWED